MFGVRGLSALQLTVQGTECTISIYNIYIYIYGTYIYRIHIAIAFHSGPGCAELLFAEHR